MLSRKLILAFGCLWLSTAMAATIEQPLADAGQEATARAIFQELRCVVCEGQSLADSDATLAREMRALVRTRVGKGESREDVLSFFRTRYGDQILMTPPVAERSIFLWLAPLLFIALGGGLIWRFTKHDTEEA